MAVKNRVWVLLLVLALLLSLAAASLLLQPNAPDSEELLALLENTLAADSYCYEMYATVETAGGTRSYFDLSGAVSGDNAQLSGTVLGTQTALMFCDGMLYQQIGDIWYAHSMGDIQDAAAPVSYTHLYDAVVGELGAPLLDLFVQRRRIIVAGIPFAMLNCGGSSHYQPPFFNAHCCVAQNRQRIYGFAGCRQQQTGKTLWQ